MSPLAKFDVTADLVEDPFDLDLRIELPTDEVRPLTATTGTTCGASGCSTCSTCTTCSTCAFTCGGLTGKPCAC